MRNRTVTGFTFGLVIKSTGAALAGVASAMGKSVTKEVRAESEFLNSSWSVAIVR